VTAGVKTIFANGNGATVSATPLAASSETASEIMATVTHAANVRSGPSGSAPVISTLRRGLEVSTGESKGNWTRVKLDGKDGWVFSSYLKTAPPKTH
jgi:uncharacterized protein YraI